MLRQSNGSSTVKILGVVLSSNLWVAEHINSIISSCAQAIHTLRILRAHGMPAESVHMVFRAVVIKLTYASSAWWGFTTTADRQRLQAIIRHSVRTGLCRTTQHPAPHSYKMLMINCSTVFCATVITSSTHFYPQI